MAHELEELALNGHDYYMGPGHQYKLGLLRDIA
jgi:hypothetical protein